MGIRDHARLISQIAGTREARKAFRSMEDSIANMGTSPLEWLGALPALEQLVASLIEAARASKESSDDLRWWMTELNLRLSELEKLTLHFAPWASTKFRMLRATKEQQTKWIAELSLASADRIYSEITDSLNDESDSSLHEGAAENAHVGTSANLDQPGEYRFNGVALGEGSLDHGEERRTIGCVQEQGKQEA